MSIPATGALIAVYRPPDFDLVATPTKPKGIEYRPEKNGPGMGVFSIPMNDPAYGDIQVNDFVAIRPDGNTVAVFIVEMIHEHTLDEQGGARQLATYTGRLAGCQLEWALIAPSLGDQHNPVQEDSILDWRSRKYSPAAYGDPWTAATEILTVTAAITAWPTPAGEDFAQKFTDSTGAYMIWDSSGDETEAPAGTCLFYLDVDTTSSPGRHGLEVLMDNQGLVWVDEVQQLDIHETEGYHVAAFKRIELSAAVHRFAFLTTNLGSGNPAALAFNLFKVDHQDRPLEGVPVVAISDSSVQVLSYPDPFPGMTVGDDLVQFVAEAQGSVEAERDVFPWLVCNFDMDDDSNGDPWPRESITTKTQTTNLLQFLDELVAAGRISRWFIDKDGVTLNAYAPGFTTRPTFSAPYTAGYELEPAPVNDPRSGQLVLLDRKIT